MYNAKAPPFERRRGMNTIRMYGTIGIGVGCIVLLFGALFNLDLAFDLPWPRRWQALLMPAGVVLVALGWWVRRVETSAYGPLHAVKKYAAITSYLILALFLAALYFTTANFSPSGPSVAANNFRGDSSALSFQPTERKPINPAGRYAVEGTKEVDAGSSFDPSRASSLTRSILVNDVPLPEDQANQLERAYQTRIENGQYWYDRILGAWGPMGGPTAGFIAPGLNLGGRVRRDSSHGNTGVIINGRELPGQDWALLQQRVRTAVPPGSYWLDAQGNWGYEGGPARGNIGAAASSGGGSQRGVFSTWDRTGVAVYPSN